MDIKVGEFLYYSIYHIWAYLSYKTC